MPGAHGTGWPWRPTARSQKGARLRHPALADVARRVGRSPALVLLRRGLQQGLVVLPQSTHLERIRENLAVFDFDLDAASVARLDALEAGLATGWDFREQA